MNVPEIISVAIAAIALLVACLALARASVAMQARAQLQAYLQSAQQTDIQVLYLKKSAGSYNFTLANRGGSVARNIRLRTVGEVSASCDPLAEAARSLPVPQLDPGSYFQIPVTVRPDTPSQFRLQVEWTNAGGLESTKEIALSRID